MKSNKHKLKRKQKNLQMNHTVEIVSAHVLEQSKVEELAQIFDINISDIETKIDPSILGGIIIRKGSVVYDGSIKSKLENLKQALFNKLHTA